MIYLVDLKIYRMKIDEELTTCYILKIGVPKLS
jgi:hypothetical protein